MDTCLESIKEKAAAPVSLSCQSAPQERTWGECHNYSYVLLSYFPKDISSLCSLCKDWDNKCCTTSEEMQ